MGWSENSTVLVRRNPLVHPLVNHDLPYENGEKWRHTPFYTPKLILYKMHMLYVYKMLFRDSFYRGFAWPSIKCPSRAPYFIIL